MIIGLTGGIASGKSTVSAYLASKGIPVFDADRSAWHVEEAGSPCLEKLADRFGKGILLPDGSLNRKALAHLVFSNPEARKDLNRIVHAAVEQEREEFLAVHRKDPLVVLDVPLLLECHWDAFVDQVWLVFVSEEEQIKRAMERSQLTREEVTARIESQMPLTEKRQKSDVVIDNSGSLKDLYVQVDRALNSLSL